MTFVKRLIRDEHGQDLAEYAIALAVITIAVIAAVQLVGTRVTTLTDPVKYPAKELAALYGQRWKIELCFRYIKTQMDLGFLECHSAQMLRKEWLAGLIAYNLIRWTMAVAAASAQVALQRLSFSRTRELLIGWIVRSSSRRRRLRSRSN